MSASFAINPTQSPSTAPEMSTLESVEKKEKAPASKWDSWDRNSHFQIDDIQRLSKKAIGLRHVTGRERALNEQKYGIKDGCAFNLTFQKGEHSWDAGFEHLPQEIVDQALTEDQKFDKIVKYDQAVSKGIKESITRAVAGKFVLGQTTRADVYDSIKETCFLLIDYYRIGQPTDFNLWNGLGRFPKMSIDPNRIKAVLPFFHPSEMKQTNLHERITHSSQSDEVMESIVEWVRIQLLNQLRKEPSPFMQFNGKFFRITSNDPFPCP